MSSPLAGRYSSRHNFSSDQPIPRRSSWLNKSPGHFLQSRTDHSVSAPRGPKADLSMSQPNERPNDQQVVLHTRPDVRGWGRSNHRQAANVRVLPVSNSDDPYRFPKTDVRDMPGMQSLKWAARLDRSNSTSHSDNVQRSKPDPRTRFATEMRRQDDVMNSPHIQNQGGTSSKQPSGELVHQRAVQAMTPPLSSPNEDISASAVSCPSTHFPVS